MSCNLKCTSVLLVVILWVAAVQAAQPGTDKEGFDTNDTNSTKTVKEVSDEIIGSGVILEAGAVQKSARYFCSSSASVITVPVAPIYFQYATYGFTPATNL
jgi:hypothetical protein